MSTHVEERLRRALSARAGGITPGHLRPAAPPTAAPARRFWLPWWRSLLAVAVVLAAAVLVVRLPAGDPPSRLPDLPAATVPVPAPTPSAVPTTTGPVPSSPVPTGTPSLTASTSATVAVTPTGPAGASPLAR